MAGWFKAAAEKAGGLVKNIHIPAADDPNRVDSKVFGVFSGVGGVLKKTLNEAGRSQEEQGANLDTSEDAPPWAFPQPSRKQFEPEVKKLVLQITEGPAEEVRARLMEPPPPESEFDFDFEKDTKRAMAALAADKNLSKVRFDLVPMRLKEMVFWRNYFYRVEQIRREFLLRAHQQPAAASKAGGTRYADASDNLDGGDGEFASDDVVHVSLNDDAIRAQLKGELGLGLSGGAASAPSKAAASAPAVAPAAGEEEEAEGEADWELEMRRELEMDDDCTPTPKPDSTVIALSDEIDKELDFDDDDGLICD